MNQQFLTLLEELKKLNFPKDKYAVFGSGPLAIRNIRETFDLDVIVKQDFFNELWDKYPECIVDKPFRCLVINNIEFVEEWNYDFEVADKIINNAGIIEDIPFVTLEDTIVWKTSKNREKDLEDIKLINEYLKNHE